MVKIEGISAEELHSELKKKKVEKLVKEVFGKEIEVDECVGNLFVREKSNLINILKMSPNPSFLNIYLSLGKNNFELKDSKYFDKTYELANKYETNFGGEVTIKLDYSN